MRQDDLEIIKNNKQESTIGTRKVIGLGLVGLGVVVFILLLVLVNGLAGILYASPFLITGFITLIVRKHTALWNGWLLYLMGYLFLKYATGIQLWCIFVPEVYQNGIFIQVITAWLMVISFVILMITSFKMMRTIYISKYRSRDL